MKFIVEDQRFEIDDVYALKSPLIHTIHNTDISIHMVDGYIQLDVDADHFREYISYLQGNTPIMDEEICRLFDFMGHTNTMEYPPAVWAMKLHDNWIRDNMYEMHLYDDPLYDLVEIPIVRKIPIEIPHGWYVAGGAAMWMAGRIDKLNDIDLFTCMSQDDAVKSMMFLNDTYAWGHSFTSNIHIVNTYNVSVSSNCISYTYEADRDRYQVQFILRLYKAPTEIVHGFDLDCVGIIYDPSTEKLYATKRAQFSHEKHTNYLDPARASPSYVGRLLKYMRRKYRVYLPHLGQNNINYILVERYMDEIRRRYHKYIYSQSHEYHMTDSDRQPRSMRGDEVLEKVEMAIKVLSNSQGIISMDSNELIGFLNGAIRTDTSCEYKPHEMYSYAISVMPPNLDPVSQLILAVFFGFYPSNPKYKVGDYDRPNIKKKQPYNSYREYMQNSPFFNEDECYIVRWDLLRWKSQNPMEQVSSTCIPTPIDDLQEWYKSSPFHTQSNIPYTSIVPSS